MAVTLKDVAARAGVSIQTVSNVVNGHTGLVRQSTREQVLAAISALGYYPNTAARHLRRATVHILALAIPDLDNPYYGEIGNGVIAEAAVHGYNVLLDHTGRDRAKEALLANGLGPHLVDGVILDAHALVSGDIGSDRRGVPIVLLGEHLFDAPCDHVVIDNAAAARLATTHLLSLGRRRIAVIGVQASDPPGAPSLRLQGFMAAMEDAGRPIDTQLLIPGGGWHRADGMRAMRALLDLDSPPDAVFCFNDLLALGAMKALHDAGRRIPDDMAVMGFDDIEEGLFATPSLTTVAPDKGEISRQAVAMLFGRIDGTRAGPPERIVAPFHLRVRKSTVGWSAE